MVWARTLLGGVRLMMSQVGSSYPTLDFGPWLAPWQKPRFSSLGSDEILCRVKFRVSLNDHYESDLFTFKLCKGEEPVFLRLRQMLPPEVVPDEMYLQRWLTANPKPRIPMPIETPLKTVSPLARMFGATGMTPDELRQATHDSYALFSWESAYRQAELEALIRKDPPQPLPPKIPPNLQVELENTQSAKNFLTRLVAGPVSVMRSRPSSKCFVFYDLHIWSSTQYLQTDEWKLLIERKQRQFRGKLDSIKNAASASGFERSAISDEVRLQVWQRDQGKCARCGSRENLEFDHIVPVAMGGSSTARNVELLCQNCNRSKGCSVA